MAAASAISTMKRHRILTNPLHRSHSNDKRKNFNQAECNKEKDFVAQYKSCEVLSPEEIEQDPRNKALGSSSRSLRVEDFELIKTLGTGTATFCLMISCSSKPADAGRI
jgi:protein kinase A